MQNINNLKPKFPPSQILHISAAVYAIMLGLLFGLFLLNRCLKSMSPYWNDKLIDVLILIPAVGAATSWHIINASI